MIYERNLYHLNVINPAFWVDEQDKERMKARLKCEGFKHYTGDRYYYQALLIQEAVNELEREGFPTINLF